MADATLKWLMSLESGMHIHLCAVTSEKAAAVCGWASTEPWQRAEIKKPNMDLVCAKCRIIHHSPNPIYFLMPNGRKVEVRARRA